MSGNGVERVREAGPLLLALGALYALASLWSAGRGAASIDFYQFWVVGRAVARGEMSDVYSATERAGIGELYYQEARQQAPDSRRHTAAGFRRVLETYSTPFFYALFRGAGRADYETAYTLYQILSLACTVLALAVLGRSVGASASFVLSAWIVLAVWFSPLLSDVRVANVNQIQLGLLGIWLWLRRRPASAARDVSAGLLLGVGIAFKPNLVFVAALVAAAWLASGRRRDLLRGGVGLAAAAGGVLAASGALLGSAASWRGWLGALRTLPEAIAPVAKGNYSLPRLLQEWTGTDAGPVLAVVLVAAAAAVLWRGRRTRELSAEAARLADLGAASAGCLVYLLAAPLVWLHYYVLAIPALIFVLRPAGAAEARPLVGRFGPAAVAATLIALEPLKNVVSVPSYPRLALLALGSLLLYGLVLRELDRVLSSGHLPETSHVA